MTETSKVDRLRILANRAGDLFMSAYRSGKRERAIHFNEKRKRILWSIWSSGKEV